MKSSIVLLVALLFQTAYSQENDPRYAPVNSYALIPKGSVIHFKREVQILPFAPAIRLVNLRATEGGYVHLGGSDDKNIIELGEVGVGDHGIKSRTSVFRMVCYLRVKDAVTTEGYYVIPAGKKIIFGDKEEYIGCTQSISQLGALRGEVTTVSALRRLLEPYGATLEIRD